MKKKIKNVNHILYAWFFVFNMVFCSQALADTTLRIESFNSNLFPLLYANVSVENDGIPITDLTSEDFYIEENGVLQTDLFKVTPPEQGGGVRSADIVFIIDVSGSMGSEIADVRNNVNNFAIALSQRNIDFRLGLVRFGNSTGDNPYLFNSGNLTDDVGLFQGFVNTLNASGGFEPGFLAIRQAITGFNFRPGAQKIFLIITDEDADEPRDKETTVDMLQANSITVHTSVQCNSGNSNNDYCNSNSIRELTGGLLFGVSDSYNAILDTIVEKASGTYVVQYQSSNPIFDNIERVVKIETVTNGGVGFDTTSYIPGAAPVIKLTSETENFFLPENALLEGVPVTLSADVTDNIAPFVAEVYLYYKTTQVPNSLPTAYSRWLMSNVSGNRWEFTIPGVDIQNPGIDFYITASDGVLSGSNPKVDPSSNCHKIAVLPNNAPVIDHEVLPKINGSVGDDVLIEADISDDTYSVFSCNLFYRKRGELIYKKISVAFSGTDVHFSENIPGDFITMDSEIEYYIEAQDDLGVISREGSADAPHSFLPENGDFDEDGLTNSEEDTNRDGIINGDANQNRECDPTETWTETDPYNHDTDGDALLDGWEVKGYFSDNNLFYDNPSNQLPDVNIPGFCINIGSTSTTSECAGPLKKDIFVEIDWMEDTQHTFIRPQTAALNDVVAAFQNSPVRNPDGSTGINLHLDYGQGGQNTGGGDHIPYEDLTNMGQDWTLFENNIKDVYFPASNNRRKIFHYCAFINKFHPQRDISGWSNGTPGNEFIVSLGSFKKRGGTRNEQTGTFMHELGHNLGLKHGGSDNTNFKPNYLSIMNYAFQVTGLWKDGDDGIWDYSRVALPSLSEVCLDETVGLNGGDPIKGYGTKFYTEAGSLDKWKLTNQNTHFVKNANGKINWNRDTFANDTCVMRSVNDAVDVDQQYADKDISLLKGYNDWLNLKFAGTGIIGRSKGVEVQPTNLHEELDFEAVKKIVPYPPSNLTARALSNKVRLGWNPSNLEIIIGYNVYRKSGSNDFDLIGTTEYSVYDDIDVTIGANYTYAVTAVDDYGNESVIMDEVNVIIPNLGGRRR